MFINKKYLKSIIYGGTDGIITMFNIIISQMEHHANIVPWQIIAKEKKIKIRVVPINNDGELIIDEIDKLIDEKTKFISLNHVSNSLGTINPIRKLIQKAHQNDQISIISAHLCFSGV